MRIKPPRRKRTRIWQSVPSIRACVSLPPYSEPRPLTPSPRADPDPFIGEWPPDIPSPATTSSSAHPTHPHLLSSVPPSTRRSRQDDGGNDILCVRRHSECPSSDPQWGVSGWSQISDEVNEGQATESIWPRFCLDGCWPRRQIFRFCTLATITLFNFSHLLFVDLLL